ncbi:MAG: response regulator transcription factor [Elusimicrobia bacterium]|nr:response regulator transcription factor [Elusimicrobiota bacterium]
MAEAAKVLVVEDEADSRSAAEAALAGAGYRVILADTFESGWSLFLQHQPGLAVLDLQLPDGSGVDLCQKIRAHEKLGATPVIMLTGKGGLGSKKDGFDAGADQYLVKPVLPEELLMWAKALLRRLALDHGEGDVLRAGDCELNAKAHTVRWQGVALPRLTSKEFDLLYFLVKKRPRVMSREEILRQVWDTITVDKVVDVHLYNLRKKLPPALADRVQNIPGKGFRYIE